jgi:hypothetical protein
LIDSKTYSSRQCKTFPRVQIPLNFLGVSVV